MRISLDYMIHTIWLSYYMRNRDVISFTLQNLYTQLSVHIHHLIYSKFCISCYVLGLYIYN